MYINFIGNKIKKLFLIYFNFYLYLFILSYESKYDRKI